jgi:hypothetical protein
MKFEFIIKFEEVITQKLELRKVMLQNTYNNIHS